MNRCVKFLILAAFATVLAGCNRTPVETSFGIEGSTFNCEELECDVYFFLDNQSPNAVAVEYSAELTNEREEIVSRLESVVEVPALKKIKVSKQVRVTGQPQRLSVTVANLQYL